MSLGAQFVYENHGHKRKSRWAIWPLRAGPIGCFFFPQPFFCRRGCYRCAINGRIPSESKGCPATRTSRSRWEGCVRQASRANPTRSTSAGRGGRSLQNLANGNSWGGLAGLHTTCAHRDWCLALGIWCAQLGLAVLELWRLELGNNASKTERSARQVTHISSLRVVSDVDVAARVPNLARRPEKLRSSGPSYTTSTHLPGYVIRKAELASMLD